jgi:hypothetical protein
MSNNAIFVSCPRVGSVPPLHLDAIATPIVVRCRACREPVWVDGWGQDIGGCLARFVVCTECAAAALARLDATIDRASPDRRRSRRFGEVYIEFRCFSVEGRRYRMRSGNLPRGSISRAVVSDKGIITSFFAAGVDGKPSRAPVQNLGESVDSDR